MSKPESVTTPEGWKLVPLEPTFAMAEAGHKANRGPVIAVRYGEEIQTYITMVLAAPEYKHDK